MPVKTAILFNQEFAAKMDRFFKEPIANPPAAQLFLLLEAYVEVNFFIFTKACPTGCSSCTSTSVESCSGCLSGYNRLNNICCSAGKVL